jgi:protein-tyrosine-phosphatase
MAEPERSATDRPSQTEAHGNKLPPRSVLFLCGRNSIRSPMAEILARQKLPRTTFVTSAGVRPGERDPFVDAVLAEENLSLGDRVPQLFNELEDSYFDLIITLSPEAHHQALELTRTQAVEVEYWPTFDPSVVEGTREQILDSYRELRDHLKGSVARRFEGAA